MVGVRNNEIVTPVVDASFAGAVRPRNAAVAEIGAAGPLAARVALGGYPFGVVVVSQNGEIGAAPAVRPPPHYPNANENV